MIAILLAFLCLGTGAFAEDEEISIDCSDLFPSDELIKMKEMYYVPDEKLLKEVCPPLVSFLECEAARVMLEELVSKEFRQHVFGVKHLVLDLCEADSRLQKAYLASADCFRNGLGKWLLCREMADDIYLDYRKFITGDDKVGANEVDNEEGDSVPLYERHCMTKSYALACMSIQMREECGALAHETLLELSQRSDFLQEAACRQEERLKLKSDFLEFLNQEKHSDLDIFRSYFERKKK